MQADNLRGDNVVDENDLNHHKIDKSNVTAQAMKVSKDLYPNFLRSDDDQLSVSDNPETLSCMIQEKTIETIQWYIERKKWPKRFSRALRLFAIILVIVGGLAPLTTPYIDLLLHQVYGPKYEIGQLASTWGYMALALSGSFILMDNLFGFSTTWMRYITTQIKLQQSLYAFQMDWVIIKEQCRNIPPATTPETSTSGTNDPIINCDGQKLAMLKRLKTFRMDVLNIVENETQSWITEFKSSLALLEKQAHEGQKKITHNTQTLAK